MAFTIPNLADASTYPAQAEPDSRDFDILAAGIGGVNGVASGCAVTAQGTPDATVAVASGTVVVASVLVSVSSGNVTMTAAHASLPRFDFITVNNAGTKAYTVGTAASTPVFPAIPANSVVLAAIYVPANDNIINSTQIVDKRVSVPTPASGAGWTTVSKATDQTKASDAAFANDSALTFAVGASTKYRIRGVVVFNTQATPDFKWQFTGPAAPTLLNLRYDLYNNTTGLVGSSGYDSAFSTSHSSTSTGVQENSFWFNAIFHNGVNAGTFALQWAQNTSDAGATIVRAGSYIEWAVA